MDLTYVHLITNGSGSSGPGAALASSTSATDITAGAANAGVALAFAADTLRIGQRYRVAAAGIVSTTGTPNLTLGLYYGGVAGTALASTGALATGSGLSNVLWHLDCKVTVVSTGSTGSMYALGTVFGPYAGLVSIPASSSSGNLVASLDTTAAKILTVGATWGTSSASNSIQVIEFRVERLNEGSA